MTTGSDSAHAARIRGGIVGLCVGDALGVPVEFRPRERLDADPVVDLRAFGTHHQPKGTWSDDASMALCLAESLVERGFDVLDQADRWRRWMTESYWTPHGVLFDIGNTTRAALAAVARGAPQPTGLRDDASNGNGSLMRALPLAVFVAKDDEETLLARMHASSAVTHAHARSQVGCGLYALLVRWLLDGAPPEEALRAMRKDARRLYAQPPHAAELSKFGALMDGNLATVPRASIGSGGYVVHTLTAAMWCVLRHETWSTATLAAVNLGEDTDTTGAVTGGLAGLVHGIDGIPRAWRDAIARRDDVLALVERFAARVGAS